MKKLIALLLAMTMVLGMGATVMAADGTTEHQDVSSITITKTYKAPNGGQSPAETFGFSALSCESVTDAAEDVTKDNAPIPTIGEVTYAEGDATADGTGTGTKTATITLPTYTSVGIYTYKFNEAIPTTKTAGVTYNEEDLYLVVTVIEQNGKVRVAAVHCEGGTTAGTYGQPPKTDKFENKYESGTLAITKEVTGNLGDQSKYFDVTVTFTAASGEAINSTITYTGGQYEQAVTVENNTATIHVKHGDTVTFANVPEGVTYTVVETDYTGADKYDEAAYTFSDNTKTIAAGDADTCTITNNKEQTIDTGINMDSLPYFVIIGIVAVVAVVFFMKRRASAEE